VADPYQDLAILWRDLGEFGGDVQHAMWQAYGIAAPNERTLGFHLCMDEFFRVVSTGRASKHSA